MKHVYSLSGGKDSVALVLRAMELKMPMTHVVFYDAGMEFKALYKVIDTLKTMVEAYGAEFVVLKPDTSFLFEMLVKPVNYGKEGEHYGYSWCGGCTRWRTSHRVSKIQSFLDTLGEYIQYVGIAADEPERIKNENGKVYPLVEWNFTEADCLAYCYEKGIHWYEETSVTASGYIDLYEILDRVSCYCCSNKNLKELYNMYHYFYDTYWAYLKGMQNRIAYPFHSDGKTIFDLERRFINMDNVKPMAFDLSWYETYS